MPIFIYLFTPKTLIEVVILVHRKYCLTQRICCLNTYFLDRPVRTIYLYLSSITITLAIITQLRRQSLHPYTIIRYYDSNIGYNDN